VGGADISRVHRKYFSGNAVEVDLKVGGAFIVRTPDGSVHISGEVFGMRSAQEADRHLQRHWPALTKSSARHW